MVPGSSACSARTPQTASPSPSAPPASASTTLSVSSCRTSRRREAPSAARIATSRSRVATARQHQVGHVGAGDQQHQPDRAHEERAARAGSRPRCAPAARPARRPSRCCWPGMPAPAAGRSSSAPPARAAGPRPARAGRPPRGSRCARPRVVSVVSGAQTSTSSGTDRPRAPAPTIVYGTPPSVIWRPTASARPPNSRRQKPSLSTATRAAPLRSSSSRKPRPTGIGAPSTRK